MDQPDFERAMAYALARLSRELSPKLTYHSLAHTQLDVVPAAERLAALEGVTDPDLMLLCTAAYFHDIGYVEQWADHEVIGVRIVRTILPRFGYGPAHIEAISGMIMATRIPQRPDDLLQAILADADLDLLGRTDYLDLSHALRAERAALGHVSTDQEWYGRQLKFIQSHRFLTAAAQRLREAKQQENIEMMARLFAQSQSKADQTQHAPHVGIA